MTVQYASSLKMVLGQQIHINNCMTHNRALEDRPLL